MTFEELYDCLQEKYTDAAQELHNVPNDKLAIKRWRYALNDMLVFLASYQADTMPPKDDMAF